ncbi:unnamed protein product [Haemonchus placei]|uniref:CHK domain-containing protein n=1 Tax=Haemonchus placei TaxID=6290 RepID=A0A0N4W8V4_HAEPC|nr:unnamed protein product [Haemonchus placei]
MMGLVETSEGLFGTGVNLEDVERGLRRGLKTSIKCAGEKEIIRIGENQGFLSSVGVLRCNWSGDSANLPTEVVFKIATLANSASISNRSKKPAKGEVARRNKLLWEARERNLRKWHNNEILFYETVAQLPVQLSIVPKLYHGRKFDKENESTGFLCMEYAKNSFPSLIHDCLTLSQTKEVLRALIDVQIGMMSVEKKKDCFNVNVYEELYSEMLQPTVLSFRLDELRSLDDSLSSLINSVDSRSRDIVSIKAIKTHHLEIGMESVFVHGDMYAPNILWHYDEQEQMKISKIVDWQLETSYRHLFPTAALAFLTTLYEMFTASVKNCSEDERRRRTNRIVEKVRGILENINDFRK